MTVHRKLLAEELQRELDLLPTQADFLVKDFFELIASELEKNNSVYLSGFGNFVLRDKKARPGRNVTTNEVVMIEERRVVSFKAGVKLRVKVKENIPVLLNKLDAGSK